MKKKYELLECNVPTITGRIYPEDEVIKAVDAYQYMIKKGHALGTLGLPNNKIELEKVSHKVNSMEVRDGKVYAELEILNTPYGNLAKDRIDNIRGSISFLGVVLDDNTVSDLKIFSTLLIPNNGGDCALY